MRPSNIKSFSFRRKSDLAHLSVTLTFLSLMLFLCSPAAVLYLSFHFFSPHK